MSVLFRLLPPDDNDEEEEEEEGLESVADVEDLENLPAVPVEGSEIPSMTRIPSSSTLIGVPA